ncbi:ATP-binding protein [Mucilaginibacter sp. HC2]|uniref:ATP-binding protein n=1 Tax=Mucilaginibacter inviolabilis TaxID=2714892 RepID=UPI0014092078|nr:ATP-binding protein [Mucilaginibacter inviolabilis]NHA05463.1 ATP-binding protein [Mucilaginibacter inviolabilis]
MSKYSWISHELYANEGGKFQRVCNYYLKKMFRGVQFTPGSEEDTDKTRPGRPDSYIVLDEGGYILTEITTHDNLDKGKYNAKLRKDLEGCLEFDKWDIEPTQVKYIVLCTNKEVDFEVYESLRKLVKSFEIPLTILGVNELTNYLYDKGRMFARDIFGIPFETGQILDKAEFLNEYSGKGFVTPLDNNLYGREPELFFLKSTFEQSEITVITGSPGVGKSKLAIQAMAEFVKDHPKFEDCYIWSKPESIMEEIVIFFESGKSYIILIDDANRQLENLLPILVKTLASDFIIKLVLTVRDYAKEDVEKHLINREFKGVRISRLSDDTIDKIIYNAPFGVLTYQLRARVIEIAKGNPRLAIMAADAVKKVPDIALLNDVSSIYESYFNSVVKDKSFLAESSTIKVLGILSFFQTLDIQEKEDQDKLKSFGISISEFSEIVHVAEAMELVEINYKSVAKIGDQVLGTYLFHLAFVKKGYLSQDTLFFEYFNRYVYRIRDTYLPAINAFGEEQIMGKARQPLLNYLLRVQSNYKDTVHFLEVFGIYLPMQCFSFIRKLTDAAEQSIDEFDFTDAYRKTNPHDFDPVLRLLEPFYERSLKEFSIALGLAIQHVQKRKSLLDLLVKQIRTPLFANGDDLANGLQKQNIAYNFFKTHLNDSYIYKILFYYGFQHALLNTTFSHDLYEVKDGDYVFKEEFIILRNQFWLDIKENYEIDKDICYDLLIEYLEQRGDLNYVYLILDQVHIAEIVKSHFVPSKYEDCYFVQEYINLLTDKRIEIKQEVKVLQKKYHNKIYSLHGSLALVRNRVRKQFLDYEIKDIWQAKLDFVKKTVVVSSFEDFLKIYEFVEIIRDFKFYHKNPINFGLPVLFENIFLDNIELGFQTLAFYLEKGNIIEFTSTRLCNIIFRQLNGNYKKLYDLISWPNYKLKQIWLENYFEWLPEDGINVDSIALMLTCFRHASNHYNVHPPYFEKYEKFKPGTYKDVVETLVLKHECENQFIYKIPFDFFKEYPYIRDKYFELSKKIYFQQDVINHSFDTKSNDLFFLMEKDVNFFNEYIDYRVGIYKAHYSAPDIILTKIWDLAEGKQLVYDTFVKLNHLDFFSHGIDQFIALFFIQLDEKYYQDAEIVFKQLITFYPNDPKMLSVVWDILRNYMKNLYVPLIKFWLSLNKDVTFIDQCDWNNNSFSYTNGRQIWADYRIKELDFLSEAIDEMPNQHEYLDHQIWLEERIQAERKNAEYERKRIYRGFD